MQGLDRECYKGQPHTWLERKEGSEAVKGEREGQGEPVQKRKKGEKFPFSIQTLRPESGPPPQPNFIWGYSGEWGAHPRSNFALGIFSVPSSQPWREGKVRILLPSLLVAPCHGSTVGGKSLQIFSPIRSKIPLILTKRCRLHILVCSSCFHHKPFPLQNHFLLLLLLNVCAQCH